jgi:hypothetical protein
MSTETFRWTFGIGDPSLEGWLICILYLTATILSYKKYSILKSQKRLIFKSWGFISLILLFLSLNKQLDFQTIVSDIGRTIAVNLDLMEQRHIFKRVFIITVALSGIAFIINFRKNIFHLKKSHPLTFVGLTALVCFIFLRATSFHIFSDSFNHLLEFFYFFEALELSSLITILTSILLSKKDITSNEPRPISFQP